MQLRSGRRLMRSLPPPHHGARSRHRPGGADLISALPDDLLLLVLARLRCIRTAARTGLNSRRWRGLWTGLTDLCFCSVAPAEIEAVLARLAASPSVLVYTLDICLPPNTHPDRANSLLRAAALFSPAELVFTHPGYRRQHTLVDIGLPCFPRATTVELDVAFYRIRPPLAGEFAALERLSITGEIVDLGTMLDRCPRLRMLSVTFRRTMYGSIQAALASIEAALASIEAGVPRPAVCLLDICIPQTEFISYARFASLLHAAARVSPQKLVFTHDHDAHGHFNDTRAIIDADLPCFNRATSIEISFPNVRFTQLSPHEFSPLEMLSVSNCSIVDMASLLSRCPRLRVLTMVPGKSTRNITVHSASLLELDIHANNECLSIDIVTPVLKQLMLKAQSSTKLSVSAPMVEKVSSRRYTWWSSLYGFWFPGGIGLETLPTDNSIDNCSQIPPVHALILDLSPYFTLGEQMNFAQEMKNLLVTDFSMLELHLSSNGHVSVSGALMLGLFGMHRIQTATQRLKVILPNIFEGRRTCRNCPCDEPKNWRRQSISQPNLEEVEICRFKGDHREFDVLKLILRGAPMLKRISVKMENRITRKDCHGGIKLYNIFLAYPSVDCYAYLHSVNNSFLVCTVSMHLNAATMFSLR